MPNTIWCPWHGVVEAKRWDIHVLCKKCWDGYEAAYREDRTYLENERVLDQRLDCSIGRLKAA